MKQYDKNKELSYLQNWDVNNLYGWAMSQKLPLNVFKWVKYISEFNEHFMKSYVDESDEGYFLEVEDQYPQNLHNSHIDIPFLPERMKIKKVEKPAANLHDNIEYVRHKQIQKKD